MTSAPRSVQAIRSQAAAHGARLERVAVVILFMTIIAAPGTALLLGVDRGSISEAEMRELAPPPAWPQSRQAIAAWPSAFEKYFEDHFGFRARLIHWQASLLWRGLRTSASDTVIAGTDGWLYYADDGGMEDYVETTPFTDPQLAEWQRTLEANRAWLHARGIPYLFVVAPDKQMVYPEHMPSSLHRLRQDYHADQLIAYLHAHSTMEVLDLRPAIVDAKDGELLYHLYDTHWNDRGGLVGYTAIVRRLQQWLPDVRPLARADFDEVPGVPSGDKTTMLGLVDPGKVSMPGLVPKGGQRWRIVEPAHPDPYGEDGRLVTEISDRSLPRVVMFRDSFGGRLIPYLSAHFSRAVYLWQNNFEQAVIEAERPTVVIQEMVGRHLAIIEPYTDVLP